VQSGDLDILFPTGLLVQQSVVEGAQRKRVAAETDLSVAATAFRMRSTESQVVLHVEETEAQFAVSPELELRPEAQNVIMTARVSHQRTDRRLAGSFDLLARLFQR
jgi:hypothetical protein